ncbi:phage portal protein [Magnetococcales bacterium HHB-1]
MSAIKRLWSHFSNRLRPKAQLEAARAARRFSTWKVGSESTNTLILQGGDLLRNRARDLVRSNPYAANATASFAAHVVGAGIKPSLLLPDADLKEKIQRLWLDWVSEADADGQTTFYGLQAMAARSLFEVGETFIRFRPRRQEDGLSVPLQLQILPAEQLPLTKNEQLPNGRRVSMGIEFDRIGRRRAYHFYRNHPGDIHQQNGKDFIRVPAEEVLHVFQAKQEGQIRGLSQLTPAIPKLHLLEQYDDAELERKKVAAMYAAFVTKPDFEDAANQEDQIGDEAAVHLQPGTLEYLLPGEDVKFSDPADVGGAYEAFQYRTLLACCAAMGIPYSNVTGDLKRANYSSLREAKIEFRRRVEPAQNHILIFQLCRPVWNRWINDVALSGVLTLPGYADNPRPYRRVKWIPPRWDWVDPLKDRKADIEAIKMGIKSRSDVIESEGSDPEEVDRRIQIDQQREEKLGLQFEYSPKPTHPLEEKEWGKTGSE